MEDQDLDWGAVTPEGYDDANREAFHILNVNFIGEENRNRVLTFVCARILHFSKHLPQGSSQRIRFDLRGQWISDKNLNNARQTIVEKSSNAGIPVKVEFLTN